MRALVVDPGKMTGAGWLDWNPGAQDAVFDGFEAPHFEFLRWAEDVISPGICDRVVCEGFSVGKRTTQEDPTSVGGLWSVKQIGCLELWCHQLDIPFLQQMPSAKSFGDDAKLKAVGWYAPAKGVTGERGHRRDAARHALKYAIDHNLIDPGRLLP